MPLCKPFEGDAPAVKACRVLMFVGGTVTVTLSSVVLARAARVSWPDTTHFLLEPSTAAAGIGSVALITSLVGIGGAATSGRLTLITFIFLVTLSATLTLYLAVLCFLSANTSTRLASSLAEYVHGFGGSVTRALVASGAACTVGVALMCGSAAAAGRVAGWRWTRSKMPALLNAVNLILGALLLSLASYAVTQQKSANTQFALAVGALCVLGALFGGGAVYTRWPQCLKGHAVWSAVAGMLGALTAAACIAAGNVRAKEETVQSAALSADRLLLLGAYAVIASGAHFAEAVFVSLELAWPAGRGVEPVELKEAYDEFVGDRLERSSE